jgi:hypothetical protein
LLRSHHGDLLLRDLRLDILGWSLLLLFSWYLLLFDWLLDFLFHWLSRCHDWGLDNWLDLDWLNVIESEKRCINLYVVHNLNIERGLFTKLDIVTVDQSEHSEVRPWVAWSGELNFNREGLSWRNDLIFVLWLRDEVEVSIHSLQLHLWPSSHTGVLEYPSLFKFRPNENWSRNQNWLMAFGLEWLHQGRQGWHGNLAGSAWNNLRREIVLALQECWSLAWMSDLEHWVWWIHPIFALFAEVEVVSDSTLVSYSQNRISVAPVASDLWVNNFGLLLSPALEMSRQHFLVLLSAVGLHLVAQNLLQIFEELIVDLACSIAFLARETIFIDHLAIAFEALWQVIHVLRSVLPRHILGPEDEAADHFLVSDGIFLTGLRLSHNLGITHCIFGHGFALGCDLVGVDHSSNILIMGVDSVGIASEAVLNFLVSELLNHVSRVSGLGGTCDVVIAASN